MPPGALPPPAAPPFPPGAAPCRRRLAAALRRRRLPPPDLDPLPLAEASGVAEALRELEEALGALEGAAHVVVQDFSVG